jgi:hypothetical protein
MPTNYLLRVTLSVVMDHMAAQGNHCDHPMDANEG